MAKRWKPSLKQASEYDELLRKQNITRKRLLRIRRITEEESYSGRTGLPDLILPKKARRYRDLSRYTFNSYEEFRELKAKLKAEYSDFELSFSKAHYFQNYKNAILSMLQEEFDKRNIVYDMDKSGLPKGEGWRGRFTDEQIEDLTYKAPELKKFIEFFNKVAGMNTDSFITMYFSGEIPVLKYIYLEMLGSLKEDNQIERFYSDYQTFWKRFRSGNIMTNRLFDYVSSRKAISPSFSKTLVNAIWKDEKNKK